MVHNKNQNPQILFEIFFQCGVFKICDNGVHISNTK
jgi:hypothetical protein